MSSFEDGRHVYFIFREAAIEYTNCGKAVFSRVARVCKNDEGGSHKFRNRWTTFIKARVNCSIPGEYPFYFNEIQSTTGLIQDSNGDQVIYAVFTTPSNSIPGSAICKFTLADITNSFAGTFKGQSSSNSNWLPLPPSSVPSSRPGQCYNQSSNLSESSLHFIKNNCLMDKAVHSRPTLPVFIATGEEKKLTKIAVHCGVKDLEGNMYDILYAGTTTGGVMKILINLKSPDKKMSQVLEQFQVFNTTEPVLHIQIFLFLPSKCSSFSHPNIPLPFIFTCLFRLSKLSCFF